MQYNTSSMHTEAQAKNMQKTVFSLFQTNAGKLNFRQSFTKLINSITYFPPVKGSWGAS